MLIFSYRGKLQDSRLCCYSKYHETNEGAFRKNWRKGQYNYVCLVPNKINYNIVCVLPNLTNSYWRHHGTFLNIRMAVRPSDDVCKSDGEACVRYVIKKRFTERQHHKKCI